MDTNIIFYIVSAVYGVTVAIFTFFSLFSIYVLIRYGKSKNLALAGSLVFGAVFLILLFSSLSQLSRLRA